MNILLRSDAGPIEGFQSARFRVAISDEGSGEIEALPEFVESIAGDVVCSVDGTDVFVWRVEDRASQAREIETVTVSGRGIAASLERAIVLPEGYPNYTERTRSLTGAPFGVWATLLAEAQARGRVPGLTPTWTATEDSNGDPWQETIDFQLDPGVTLADLLREVAEVEVAEWIVRPDRSIEAARQFGVDRSNEVVLFVGRDQVQRGRRESSRNQRQTVFLEASTGVSEVTNSYTGPDAGEIWLEGQDFADPLSRGIVAERLAERLAAPEVEVEVEVAADCGIFDRFDVGDFVGLDVGTGTPETVRVVGAAVGVDASGVQVELTLVSQVTLRQQQIDRAIEAKADVKLAAGTSLQRRHGLVTADKFLSGAVGTDVAISSENFVPAVPGPGEGWAIFGNGNAEFNDAIFRGDLQSDNYVPGVSGWFLDRDGNAEFEQGQFRGVVQTEGDIQIPPGAPPQSSLGQIRARSIVDAGRTIYEIGLGAYPQTNFFEAGSIFADPTDTVVVGNERQVGDTDFVGLGLAQQFGAAFLTGLKDETQAIGPWKFVPDLVRGSQGVSFIQSPTSFDAGSPVTVSTSATTGTVLTVNGRSTFTQNVTITGATTQTRALQAEGSNVYSISNYRNIDAVRDISAGRNLASSNNTFVGNQLTVQGQAIVSGDFTVFGDSLFDNDAKFNDDVDFRFTQSGRFFRMNQAGSGTQGGEPTLDTSSDLFGFVGISSRRLFRVHAGQFLTSSESRLKGEVVDADLAGCYETVKAMRLTRYSLHRDRDDYYIAKGEWMMGDREEFVDRGGPLRKLGILAEEAPDEVADETHANVDVYAYASLIAGAVKALQQRVEDLEATNG